MRRISLTLALLAAAVAAAGCGTPEPAVSGGTVIEQQFIPEHDESYDVPVYSTMCFPAGKSITCHTYLSGYDHVTEHHPDLWQINLLNCSYPDGKCRTTWEEVSRGDYLEIKTGDYWPRWWLKDGAKNALIPKD